MTADRPADGQLVVESVWHPNANQYVAQVNLAGVHRWLDHGRAMRYAVHVAAVASRANYDAAVMKQMTDGLGVNMEAAGAVLVALRAARRPVDPTSTAPFEFTPGVSLFNGKPFVALHVAKRPDLTAQLTTAAALRHAQDVLDVLSAATDDNLYKTVLTDTVGTTHGQASDLVAELANHHESEED